MININKKNIIISYIQLFANYGIPLILIPYLSRILGPSGYGSYSFYMAGIAFMLLLSDYGFNVTATREVAKIRQDKNKLSDLFSSIVGIKLIFCVVGLLVIALFYIIIAKYKSEFILIFIMYGIVIGQSITPIWMYQGLEDFKALTLITVLPRVFSTIAIFSFVNSADDIYILAALISIGYIAGGISSLYILKAAHGLVFNMPKIDLMLYQLRGGYQIFSANVYISIYTVMVPILIGIIKGSQELGNYVVAEKIYVAAKSLYMPLSLVIFPVLSKQLNDDPTHGIGIIMKICKKILPYFGFFSILIAFLSDEIISMVGGNEYSQSATLLKIMSPAIFLVTISNILGVQYLSNINREKEFRDSIKTASIIALFASVPLIYYFGAIGASITVTLSEFCVVIALIKKIKFSN
jgi:PST family polysaccharide transporter